MNIRAQFGSSSEGTHSGRREAVVPLLDLADQEDQSKSRIEAAGCCFTTLLEVGLCCAKEERSRR